MEKLADKISKRIERYVFVKPYWCETSMSFIVPEGPTILQSIGSIPACKEGCAINPDGVIKPSIQKII